MDSDNVKAKYRRGMARMANNDLKAAYADLLAATKAEPKNKYVAGGCSPVVSQLHARAAHAPAPRTRT